MKRLRRVSPGVARKSKEAEAQFADGMGVYFCEARLWLPKRVSDWPRVRIVLSEDNRRVVADRQRCFYCEAWGPVEVHHIIGGLRGRCDSLPNLFAICRPCHVAVQSDRAKFARVLYQKWKHDRAHVSWVRLTLLSGRYLDDLNLGPSDGNS